MEVVNISASMVCTEAQARLFNKGYYWAVMDGVTVLSLHLTEKAARNRLSHWKPQNLEPINMQKH